jgi:hypothetical protein
MPVPIEKKAWVKALRIVAGSSSLLASQRSRKVT